MSVPFYVSTITKAHYLATINLSDIAYEIYTFAITVLSALIMMPELSGSTLLYQFSVRNSVCLSVCLVTTETDRYTQNGVSCLTENYLT